MINEIPTVPDQVNVITLKCAKEWHDAFKEHNNKEGFAQGEFPSSIVVPYADIEQIVNDFKKEGAPPVNGVRIYFVIKPVVKPNGGPNISAICVPTKGPFGNVPDIDPKLRFTDMIVKATLKAGAPPNPDCHRGSSGPSGSARLVAADSDDDYVSIYDVTQPCPPFCDPESL